MQETQDTWVQFLHQEDPLEEGMATHSSILAWSIPWTEEPGELQSMGLQRVRQDLVTEQLPKTEDLFLKCAVYNWPLHGFRV